MNSFAIDPQILDLLPVEEEGGGLCHVQTCTNTCDWTCKATIPPM